MKKLMCIMLSVALLLALNMPAFAAERLLTPEDGAKALADAFDMHLEYKKVSGENRAALVWGPEISLGEYVAVDAVTGKRVKLAGGWGGGYDNWLHYDKRELSAAEILQNGLLSKGEITEIIKGMTETVFCDFSISSITYIYSGYFNSADQKFDYRNNVEVKLTDGAASAEVYLDAKSGALQWFTYDKGVFETVSAEPEKNRKNYLSAAKNFIKERAYMSMQELALTDERYNYFIFSRKVNEIAYEGNYVIVSVDLITGKITGFKKLWNTDTVFDSKENLIPKEFAKMLYVSANHPELLEREILAGDEIKTASVYMLTSKDFYNTCIDAKNGRDLYDSTELVDLKKNLRTDYKKLFLAILSFGCDSDLLTFANNLAHSFGMMK